MYVSPVYNSIIMSIVNIPLALYLGHLWGALGVVFSVGFLNMITAAISYVQVNKIINNKAHGIWAK